MSRVVYTEFHSTSDQEALRLTHQVRIVAEDEEGTGVNALPGGVYGFTYSPGLASSPLFSVRRYRSYETHKLPSGVIYIIGFATPDEARALSTAIRSSAPSGPIRRKGQPRRSASVARAAFRAPLESTAWLKSRTR